MRPGIRSHDVKLQKVQTQNSSVTITDQLFGDDLGKEVKELIEVNLVGKKVATSHGSTHR